MHRIRLRYSTLVNYSASLYRLATSILFIVIVARKLPIQEFGIWGITFSLITFLSIPMNIWMFWATRFIARNVKGSFGTSFIITLLFMTIISPIYVFISWAISLSVGGFIYLAFYGLGLLISTIVVNYFEGISGVLAPELVGYKTGLIATLRLLLTYIFVVILKLGLSGAFLAVIIIRLLGALFLALSLSKRHLIRWDGFSRELAISWIRRGYIPLIRTLTAQIRGLDKTIVALIMGSPDPAAYLNAAYVSKTPLIEGNKAVTLSLRARILRSPSGSDVEETIRLLSLFTGFTITTLLTLTKPILSLLNPKYTIAYHAFILASLSAMVDNILGIFLTAAIASEKQDLDLTASLKSTVLVKIPLANFICSIVALAIASVASWILRDNLLLAISAYPTMWMFSSIVLVIIAYRYVKESLHIHIPWRDVMATIISSIITVFIYLILSSNNIIIYSFWSDTPKLLTHVAVALTGYLSTMIAVSKWFRWLTLTALRQALGKITKLT